MCLVKIGLLKAVGKIADYQVILNAAGWLEKGVLNETDLAERGGRLPFKDKTYDKKRSLFRKRMDFVDIRPPREKRDLRGVRFLR